MQVIIRFTITVERGATMKLRRTILSLATLLALVALAAAPMATAAQKHAHSEDQEFSEQDKIDQTYTLSPGARVEVRGINGAVEVETSTDGTAEVHIVRMARTREDLNYHKILIDQS